VGAADQGCCEGGAREPPRELKDVFASGGSTGVSRDSPSLSHCFVSAAVKQ